MHLSLFILGGGDLYGNFRLVRDKRGKTRQYQQRGNDHDGAVPHQHRGHPPDNVPHLFAAQFYWFILFHLYSWVCNYLIITTYRRIGTSYPDLSGSTNRHISIFTPCNLLPPGKLK
ncbi:MAG: hypothetical protein U2P89_00135 [Proteiniphilum sp.]|uniref:hypothetical protein n=1 Tax=Proteiniphilum sp. TaxID=1926877 RepID=UPI0011145F5F|nr:hypothetical protein [Proteiniphilum sp.]MDY9917264.1 hypothetical protein [Proteiniphilum sp.]